MQDHHFDVSPLGQTEPEDLTFSTLIEVTSFMACRRVAKSQWLIDRHSKLLLLFEADA